MKTEKPAMGPLGAWRLEKTKRDEEKGKRDKKGVRREKRDKKGKGQKRA